METINVNVGRKTVPMNIVSVQDMAGLNNLAAELTANGWQVWVGFAKRPNGGKHHMIYRSARTGNFVSVQTI